MASVLANLGMPPDNLSSKAALKAHKDALAVIRKAERHRTVPEGSAVTSLASTADLKQDSQTKPGTSREQVGKGKRRTGKGDVPPGKKPKVLRLY